MRNIKIAALQFSCCSQVQENIDKAETMVREAASNGANLILLPELFERPYFCQEKRYDYYDYALPLTENPAIRRFQAVAGELGVVIPVSFSHHCASLSWILITGLSCACHSWAEPKGRSVQAKPIYSGLFTDSYPVPSPPR